jgi:large subunit ribosomal protein L15
MADKSEKTEAAEAKAPKKTKAAAAESTGATASASTAKASGSKAGGTKAAAGEAATRRSNVTEGAGGTLKLHHLRPAPGAHTRKTRVGRGEGSKGKTAGRGTKGTKARYQVPERFEGGQMPLHMRLPKLRGFKNPFREEYQVVNVGTLAELYPQGGDVTVEDLVAKGAVRKGRPVKVLGTGEIDVKLTVAVQAVSSSAKDKILAAGGSVDQD